MCNLLKPLHRAWRTITLTGNVHVGLSIRSVEDENTANKDGRWCEGTTLMLEKTVEILPAAHSSIRCLPLRFLFSKLHARLKNRKEKSMKWMLYLYSFLAFQCPGQEVAGFSSLKCLHSLEKPATTWQWRLHWGTFNHVVIFSAQHLCWISVTKSKMIIKRLLTGGFCDGALWWIIKAMNVLLQERLGIETKIRTLGEHIQEIQLYLSYLCLK